MDDFGGIEPARVIEITDWGLIAQSTVLALRNAMIDLGHDPDAWKT
ncbi:hypothetical protein [Phenylobacterium sp.]|jgi:hypothetical protein|nr:hypothetical protein [Phenylobacterium sp.]